jgi:uncharacterized membrane protein YhaH (DUF805 family)
MFSFRGRVRRVRYLSHLLISCVLAGLGIAMLASAAPEPAVLLGAALEIASIWITLASTAKRLRDVGVSSWHVSWFPGLGVLALALDDFALAFAYAITALLLSCVLARSAADNLHWQRKDVEAG